MGLTSTRAVAYWEVIPQVDAGVTLEDNPRYLNDSANAAEAADPEIFDDVMGLFIDTRLTGSYKTPANEIRVVPQLRKTTYLRSNKDLNGDTWLVDLLATHSDQRGSVGVSASYRETGVRSSEYDNATPDFVGNDTQTTKDVRPFLNYTLSPRNRVELSFSASDVTYDQTLNPNLPPDSPLTSSYFDYTYEQTVLAINHYLNDKNFFQLSLNGSSYDSQQSGTPIRNSTDSFGVNAAYNLVITPTLSANANFGVTRSSVEYSSLGFNINEEDRNLVGDIGLRKRSELTTLNVNVTRSVAPGSNGSEVVRDQFRFQIERTVTQRLTVSAACFYIEESAVAGADRFNRTYRTIEPTLTWRLTPTLSAYGTYTYFSDEYDRSSTTTTNNRLYVGFSYRGVGIRR